MKNSCLYRSLLRFLALPLKPAPGISTEDFDYRIKSLITLIEKPAFTTEELLEALNTD